MTKQEQQERDQQIIGMRQKGLGYREIAKALGTDRKNICRTCRRLGVAYTDDEAQERNGNNPISEETAKERFEALCPGFEYVSGYTNNHSPIRIRCKACGHEFNRIYGTCYIKDHKMQCSKCVEAEVAARRDAAAARRQFRINWREFAKSVSRFTDFSQASMKACAKCGAMYLPDQDSQLYCSKACARRAHEKRGRSAKEAKRRARMVVFKHDAGITLAELYERDKGTCWLCGAQCRWDDCRSDECGNFIAGKHYPSIDHVIPLARGGSHTWDNVRLAHKVCNTIKGIKDNPPKYTLSETARL